MGLKVRFQHVEVWFHPLLWVRPRHGQSQPLGPLASSVQSAIGQIHRTEAISPILVTPIMRIQPTMLLWRLPCSMKSLLSTTLTRRAKVAAAASTVSRCWWP
mmetsp:Transcript_30192/g.73595  ORF Transcript_30192/g.73595 Transcript_30192/m.73595 type:complete len:102 (+) Transcript_30192:1-306(+)